LHIGAKQTREHFTDVCETAVAEHRRAVRKVADRTRQIFAVAAHETHEHEADDAAILGVTLGKWPDLLEVPLQR
jgi:hypothetical protein